jgi:hypothetical protein
MHHSIVRGGLGYERSERLCITATLTYQIFGPEVFVSPLSSLQYPHCLLDSGACVFHRIHSPTVHGLPQQRHGGKTSLGASLLSIPPCFMSIFSKHPRVLLSTCLNVLEL